MLQLCGRSGERETAEAAFQNLPSADGLGAPPGRGGHVSRVYGVERVARRREKKEKGKR